MKDFKEIVAEDKPLLEGEMVQGLTPIELKEAEIVYVKLLEHLENGGTLDNMDEGLFGSIVGGIAGAVAGPAIGKAICHALGITQGILYDTLTSRLVTTALGAAIGGR
ncbi:MAG: hypothetical protein WC979_01500 [Candidatus Pacearchaeota archaeon]|jgi:uncharacterized membrane protein YeaQ/YmgE (transglycosylase-associated protein family)|nr:hypothetical protein [Clostridia bacterium]